MHSRPADHSKKKRWRAGVCRGLLQVYTFLPGVYTTRRIESPILAARVTRSSEAGCRHAKSRGRRFLDPGTGTCTVGADAQLEAAGEEFRIPVPPPHYAWSLASSLTDACNAGRCRSGKVDSVGIPDTLLHPNVTR